MKYNFVFMATYGNLYKYIFKEMSELENVKVYWGRDDLLSSLSAIEQKVAKFHIHGKINKMIRLPKKKIWYYRAARKKIFTNNKPICFVWHSHFWTEIENGIVEYLKKVYPNSKHVFFFTDPWNINEEKIKLLKKRMDIISIFDPSIAEKYEISYFPNVYPKNKGDKNLQIEYDVFFIGTEKGRKEELYELYNVCKANSIKAAFYIGKYEKDGTELDGINYIEEKIAYADVVELVKKSKCVLELKVQPDNTCSLRVQEAVTMNKLLLTNNSNVSKMPLCNKSEYIIYYENPKEIDWSFLEKYKEVNFGYSDEFSAIKWFQKIEKVLENK